MRRPRDQAGTALVEFVWLALILMVPLLYIVLATFEAQRSAYAASAAARSASRAFVEGRDVDDGLARARTAAVLAFADQGLPAARFELRIRCSPEPGRCLVPGATVTAQIIASAALPLLPSTLGESAPGIAINAEHQSPYGTYREGRR